MFTPNSAVQGDMGWKTPWHRQEICVVRLCVRLINMNASKLVWYTLGLVLTNCKNWSHLTLEMFDNNELTHLIEADNCVSRSAVLEEANAHLQMKQYQFGIIILSEALEL